jgi:hypothetical protein
MRAIDLTFLVWFHCFQIIQRRRKLEMKSKQVGDLFSKKAECLW